MRTLTVYKLMQILLKEDSKPVYQAYKINKLEENIFKKRVRVQCKFDAYSFNEMESEYPDSVKVSSTEIRIIKPEKFRERLDSRLKYIDDDSLEKLVIKTWKEV